MSARKWLVVYALWMTLLTSVYYARSDLHIVIWSTIGVSSAAGIVLGVVHNRPRRRLPWLLLAGAVLAFAAGDTTYNLLTNVWGQSNPFPSIADLFYLGTCVMQVSGMFLLSRSHAASRDRASLIDSLVLTAGVGLLYWIFLIGPSVHRADLTPLQKLVSIAYPISDVLVLALLARLVVSVPRSTSVLLLMAGTAGLLAADVMYGLNQLAGGWHVGGPIDLGWIVLYATWGAAAMHPSMIGLTEPRSVRPAGLSAPRLALLALSSLIAPAVLMAEVARGRVHDAGLISVLSCFVFLLVLTRLAGAANTHRRAVGRERELRRAGEALVSATDTDQVRLAVQRAVGALLPPGTDHRMVLTRAEPDDIMAIPVATPLAAPGSPATAPTIGARATRLVYTRSLDPRLATELGGFEITLLCALGLPESQPGDIGIEGVLALAADEGVLVVLQGSVDVLASQAALALARISLTNALNRSRNEAYFRTLVHNTADVILIIDDDDRIRYASPSAAAVFGPQPVEGLALQERLHPNNQAFATQLLDLVRRGQQPTGGADWIVSRPDGGLLQVEASFQDLRADHTVRGLVVTLRDVTERRRLEGELRHRAFHDSLTGLANRVLFQDRVQQAVARSERSGGVVGVLFIDLDDFKVVNDTMGHQTGDQLLVAVGDRLTRVLRPPDSAARLGGDEFAALIQDADDPAEIERIAERIVTAMAEPFPIGTVLVNGDVSIGVATTAEANNDNDLLRQADLALYVAKGAGKGRWRRYQSVLHTAVLERMRMRAELDQAVENGDLTLAYQPIVALETGATVGFEALARWQHPTRGEILPGQFIDVAEETGLIVPIGNWVLSTGLDAAKRWQEAAPTAPPYVGVNVSVRQFRTPGFVETVRSQLAQSQVPPQSLLLEITESLLLPDEEEVFANLRELRELGVQVAIDDFGTGYSSLSYLRQVPLDVVKVDRSFIESIATSPQQLALVEGIVRLAGTLGLKVIAEGIENEADRLRLMRMGCPMGQGYLFARPLSYRDSIEWLVAERIPA